MKIFVVFLLINLITASNSLADESASPLPPATSTTPQVSPELSLEQATKQVANGNPGRVLSAKTEDTDGKKLHVIKILTDDGRIQQQVIDASTGSLVDKDAK